MWNPDPLFEKVLEHFESYRYSVSSEPPGAIVQIARQSYRHENPHGVWTSAYDSYMRELAESAISLEELDGYEDCAGTAQQFCAVVYGVLLACRDKSAITDIEYQYAELMLASYLLENIGDICPLFLE